MTVVTWPQPYLEQAIDDEIELAIAMAGGGKITRPAYVNSITPLRFDRPTRTHYTSANTPRTNSTNALDQWRRDWRAAGALSTKYGLSIRHDLEEGAVSVGTGNRRRDVTEAYADHPDKDAATMAAIVRAAIQLCAETREST